MGCLAVERVCTYKCDLGCTLRILQGEIVGGRQVRDGVAVRARYNDSVGGALVQENVRGPRYLLVVIDLVDPPIQGWVAERSPACAIRKWRAIIHKRLIGTATPSPNLRVSIDPTCASERVSGAVDGDKAASLILETVRVRRCVTIRA